MSAKYNKVYDFCQSVYINGMVTTTSNNDNISRWTWFPFGPAVLPVPGLVEQIFKGLDDLAVSQLSVSKDRRKLDELHSVSDNNSGLDLAVLSQALVWILLNKRGVLKHAVVWIYDYLNKQHHTFNHSDINVISVTAKRLSAEIDLMQLCHG